MIESSAFNVDVYNLLSEINLPQPVADVHFNVSCAFIKCSPY